MKKTLIQKNKKKLEEKKEKLTQTLKSLEEQDPSNIPGWENENTQDDDAFEREGRVRVEALEKSTTQSLAKVERALKKIKKGTYEICDACGKNIDPARLEQIPEAVYCISCQKSLE